MTDGGIILQIVAALVALLFILALARIYAAAVLPLVRNRRLARRGLTYEPSYQRERINILNLVFKLVPVVIVVGILAAIAIPAYQDYTARAHDRQRVADLAQIQGALAAYYLDHNVYPVSESETFDATSFATALDALVSSGYLAVLPNDALGVSYVYQSTADGTYYCLGASLEGTPPPSTCNTETLGATLDANYAVGP